MVEFDDPEGSNGWFNIPTPSIAVAKQSWEGTRIPRKRGPSALLEGLLLQLRAIILDDDRLLTLGLLKRHRTRNDRDNREEDDQNPLGENRIKYRHESSDNCGVLKYLGQICVVVPRLRHSGFLSSGLRHILASLPSQDWAHGSHHI